MSFNESSQSVPTNLIWHHSVVTPDQRQLRSGHKGAVIWFTGLSGSGKSTLARAVEEMLFQCGCQTFVLDGDNVRHGLCRDLTFSPKDRQENIRRIGEVAKLFVESGTIVLTAFISPYRADRDAVRSMAAENEFIEIFCSADLQICESRDVKGLYKKARNGEIPEFTGITSPYEVPLSPELTVDSGSASSRDCADLIVKEIIRRGIYSPDLIKKNSSDIDQNQNGRK